MRYHTNQEKKFLLCSFSNGVLFSEMLKECDYNLMIDNRRLVSALEFRSLLAKWVHRPTLNKVLGFCFIAFKSVVKNKHK